MTDPMPQPAPGVPDLPDARQTAGTAVGEVPPVPPPASRWRRRVARICFFLLALEVGLFLLISPWRDSWSLNHFQEYFPSLQDFWDDPYLKGAVSGLGL